MLKKNLKDMVIERQYHLKSSSENKNKNQQKLKLNTMSYKGLRQFQVICYLVIMLDQIWEMKWRATSWVDNL